MQSKPLLSVNHFVISLFTFYVHLIFKSVHLVYLKIIFYVITVESQNPHLPQFLRGTARVTVPPPLISIIGSARVQLYFRLSPCVRKMTVGHDSVPESRNYNGNAYTRCYNKCLIGMCGAESAKTAT